MEIKLICMDLDGTALRADRKSFSTRLAAALTAAHAKGIAIAPVTGRQYGLLPPAVTNHPAWENLVVTCNGGQIMRLATGERLFSLEIDGAVLHRLIALSERFDIPLEFSVDSHLHLTKASYDAQLPHGSLRFHVQTILAQCGVLVDSLEPLCAFPVEKAQFPWIPPELSRDVEDALRDVRVSAVWASATSMEITHPDANKGNGLLHLCRLLDISPEQTMAIGDSGNDEAMLRTAGLGIAMGNAPERLKAIADAVTADNAHDGAAAAIEGFCL